MLAQTATRRSTTLLASIRPSYILPSSSSYITRSKSTASTTAAAQTPLQSRSRFPEHFDQTIVLSNGATYTLRTPSPRAQLRLTRDTRNHPLWNPEMRGHAGGDDSGQLSKFAKKFGDMEGFGDLDFADGGDVEKKVVEKKVVATTSGKGKKK